MARFENSPNLFGWGVGGSTMAEVICEVCGKVYNEGIGIEDDDRNEDKGESVLHTEFAGLQVCECCFEKIENAVLSRMPDILKWYRNIIASRKESIQENEALLKGLPENE